MNWKNLATLALLTLLISGCSGFNAKEEPPPAPPKAQCENISEPSPFVLQPIEPKNAGDYWIVTHEDYLALADAFSDIKAWMKGVRATIGGYKKCIENHNKKIESYYDQIEKAQSE